MKHSVYSIIIYTLKGIPAQAQAPPGFITTCAFVHAGIVSAHLEIQPVKG